MRALEEATELSWEPGAAVVGGRFRLEAHARPCTGGAVWWGVERDTGRDVLLRRAALGSLGRDALATLEREVLRLRGLTERGPDIPFVAAGVERGQFVLITACPQRETLAQRLERGPLTLEEGLALGRSLLELLDWLESTQVLVAELDPALIHLEGSGAQLRGHLAELRLKRDPWRGLTGETMALLRSAWRAPELALPGIPISAAAEVYAVGLVMYAALSGRHPRGGELGERNLVELLLDVPEAPPVGELEAPRALGEVLEKMLRRNPQGRYPDAASALVDLEVIADALASGHQDPAVVVGYQEVLEHLRPPGFVGRHELMQDLGRRWEMALQGQPGLLLLEGEAGQGKSLILEQVARRGVARKALVLSSQARREGNAGSVPLLAELVASVCRDPVLLPAVAPALGDSADALARAFPELREALEPFCQLSPGAGFSQARVVLALARLLHALESQGPLLLLLDDVHWADRASLKVIEQWSRLWSERQSRVLVVMAALREANEPVATSLRRLPRVEVMPVGPLTQPEVEALLGSMLEARDHALDKVVWTLGGGNPLLSQEMVYSLLEMGALHREEQRWRFTPLRGDSLESPQHWMQRRIELLSGTVRHLLSVGALLGLQFDIRQAASLARLPRRVAMRAARDAIHRRLLWEQGEERVTLGHQSRREAFLRLLSPEQRAQLHRGAAHLLEREQPERVLCIARHLMLGGDLKAALPFALEAGRKARARFNLHLCEEAYRIALAALSWCTLPQRQEVLLELADLTLMRNQLQESKLLLWQLGEEEVGLLPGQREMLCAELAFHRSQMGRAEELGLRTLGRLGGRATQSRARRALWALWFLAAGTLRRWTVREDRRAQPGPQTQMVVQSLRTLFKVYFFINQNLGMMWSVLYMRWLVAPCAPCREKASSLVSCSLPMSIFSPTRAQAFAQEALEMFRSQGDFRGEGESLSRLSYYQFLEGRFEASLEGAQEAEQILSQCNDVWEQCMALKLQGMCLVHLGRLREALRVGEVLWRHSLELGHPHLRAEGMELLAWASRGYVPNLMDPDLEDAAARVPLVRISTTVFQVQRLLAQGEPLAAMECAEENIRQIGRFLYEPHAHLLMLATTATRLAFTCENRELRQERRRWLKKLRRAVMRAMRWQKRWPNHRAYALREYGWLRFLEGRYGEAMEALHESLRVAAARGQRYQEAQTRAVRAMVGPFTGWEETREDRRQARLDLASLELPSEEIAALTAPLGAS